MLINKLKNNHQKTAQRADLVHLTDSLNGWIDNLESNISPTKQLVKSQQRGVDLPGVEPGRLGLSIQPSEPAKPTPTLNITEKYAK